MPYVDSEIFLISLRKFARDVDAGPHRQIVLVVDGAGWHTAVKDKLPPHIHFVQLPPYSPELQPCERVWPLVNEAVANRGFKDLNELDDVLCYRCEQLMEESDQIQSRCNYHWWPKDVLRSTEY